MAFWYPIVGFVIVSVPIAANLERSAAQHIPGAICNGTQNMATHNLLRGKHLLVYETPWSGLAIVDETTKSGWQGFDVDLLDEIALELGFTYTIVSFKPEGGETWTDSLFRSTTEGDLVMSAWYRTQERLGRVILLAGHVDMSSVLVARKTVGESVPIGQRMTAFIHPFSTGLWVCISAMILISGAVDYLLEKTYGQGIRLGPSIYEYFAGTLWGGFDYPRTISSGIYQVVVAFLILVIISTYTANLTTFLTLSVQPTFSAASMEDVQHRELTACMVAWDQLQKRIEIMYPSLPQYNLLPNTDEIPVLLAANSGCEAAIVNKNDFDLMRLNKDACALRIVQTILPEISGWATNLQSPCVRQAFEWVLTELELSGKIDILYRKWFRPVGCSDVPSTANSRRLRFQGGHEYKESHSSVGSFQWPLLRRLKGIGRTESGSNDVEGTSEATQMNALDCIGIFSFWGVTTVVVLSVSMIEKRFHSSFKDVESRVGIRMSQVSGAEEDSNPAKVIDDQACRTLEILSEISALREDLSLQRDETIAKIGCKFMEEDEPLRTSL